MHILLTGGGTAGHVVPNLAIVDAIHVVTKKAKISYIGSHKGIEGELCKRAGIHFESVSTGKLRRYFDLRNFIDLFRIPLGILQAYFKIGRLKPDTVFSKGGFVGFPVVVAAWLHRTPVIIHESDSIPGLATKLSAPFAKRILLAYEEAETQLKKYKKKIQIVGNPVRSDLSKGKISKAKKLTGFNGKKPVLLVMGGSTGSQEINQIIKDEKPRLTEIFDVIHITGKGKGRSKKSKSYYSTGYAHAELMDFYALASLALSRAGASALAELETLQLPTLLYPLGRHASRGDQIKNAEAMVKKHKIFRIANQKQTAHSQLLLLPKRPKKQLQNQAAEKIAMLLTSDI